MPTSTNSHVTDFCRGPRILPFGLPFHALIIATFAFALFYHVSTPHGDAIAAPDGGNIPISVKLRPPQLRPRQHRTTGDQPYPGIQIVARQKHLAVTGPIIRPRNTKPGQQRLGRSRAVFTTPPLTLQQPSHRTPVRQKSSGIPVKTISTHRVLESPPALNLPGTSVATVEVEEGVVQQNTLLTPFIPTPASERVADADAITAASETADAAAAAESDSNKPDQVHAVEPPEPILATSKKLTISTVSD
jgi:hypothetical protein